MRKLLIIPILFLLSCSPQPDGDTKTESFGNYDIKTIDGCEYIEYDHGFMDNRIYSLTHKGNCKNHNKAEIKKDTLPEWYYKKD